MRSPLIRRPGRSRDTRSRERGVTMALIAVAMVSVIAMAALSIDIGTFYEAKAEAQRTADAAALTAARVISISGITGDQNGSTDGSWADVCGGATSPASAAAVSVAKQNLIAGTSIPTASVTVNYGVGSAGPSATDCSTLGTGFAVNPVVSVKVQRTNLPIFFGKVFSLVGGSLTSTSVSATAIAEVFNSSDSSSVASSVIPVNPRCVKPWIVPNVDPGNAGNPFVNLSNGAIVNPGVQQLGAGVIGETFSINADCKNGAVDCLPADMTNNPPTYGPPPVMPPPGNVLQYIPALVDGTPLAAPSCGQTDTYQEAIAGCDQTTVYQCGVPAASSVTEANLSVNPGGVGGDSATATECLINQATGQDILNTGTFPFQIEAGLGNPAVKAGVPTGDVLTTSNSIATIPIADFGGVPLAGTNPTVTIVGFLQVFIDRVRNRNGNIVVYVLNVSGCGNGTPNPVSSSTVAGTSPVPIRLITPP